MNTQKELLAALKAEIATLEKKLEADPNFKKLRRLMDALDAYADEEDGDDDSEISALQMPTDAAAGHTGTAEPPRQTSGRTRNEITQLILNETTTIIEANQPSPTPTSEILEQLTRRGLVVPGKRQLNNLSAMLSYSGRFQAHGRSGWTLISP